MGARADRQSGWRLAGATPLDPNARCAREPTSAVCRAFCRALGDMPSRFVVIAHGTFPNNRGAVAWSMRGGKPRVGFSTATSSSSSPCGAAMARPADPGVEGIYHRPGDDYLRSRPRDRSRHRGLPSIMPPRSPLHGRIPGLSSVTLGAAGVRSPTIRSRIRA